MSRQPCLPPPHAGSGGAAVDPLTGFATRDALEAIVVRMATARPGPAGNASPAPGIACVLTDIIGLKEANAREGFTAGDALLRRGAQRLARLAPDARLLARLGGDELVVVFTGPAAEARAARTCEAAIDGGSPALRAGWLPVRRGETPDRFFDRLHAVARAVR